MAKFSLESLLTCPQWSFQKLETMPTDACQFFYEALTAVVFFVLSRVIAACIVHMAL